MNRENEEQRPVPQTLCSALQKEPNCKCLVLTVLIYGCLAAVTWCRCANVTKIMVNFTKFPIKSTKQVSSPCDDGYIYIPVAFMGMLYLVYLVECYHSPIRIDLLHAESQDSVLSKLAQLKMAQPRIWWKAISYHYVRRKRQITRYRNGDNYTTTQVYYERVNTHSATSHYYYDYCGVKDISKELILEPKIPITKIMLTKGFAFSNIRSATEFEEARSRFFAEQELSDNYMEMREGLDLGYNVNTMLVAVLGNPWFTNRYVYWCLSALLLSWPLRMIIEYKTQYADYQVTKLFGVNYDTPTSSEPIHASMSQLSQPGSYMLAPSYSEALLMDPATPRSDGPAPDQQNWPTQTAEANVATDMVPSYSEALLYERAEQHDQPTVVVNVAESGNADVAATTTTTCHNVGDATAQTTLPGMPCECHCPCPCHENAKSYNVRMNERSYVEANPSSESLHVSKHPPTASVVNDAFESEMAALRTTADGRLHPPAARMAQGVPPCSTDNLQVDASPSKCSSCGRTSASTQTINPDQFSARKSVRNKSSGSSQTDFTFVGFEREHGAIPRDISEPNLRSRTEQANAYPKSNIRSLENILEEELAASASKAFLSADARLPRPYAFEQRQRRFPVSRRSLSLDETDPELSPTRHAHDNGAIPKYEPRSRITVNPMSNEACWKLPNSKTYFCLKSILKQNRRRYTLVTADEFQNLADANRDRECVDSSFGRGEKIDEIQPDKPTPIDRPRSRERLNPRRRMPSFEEFMSERSRAYAGDQKREGFRTLIFASPIQEVCPGDPFRGKNIVPVASSMERGFRENPAHPSRSSIDRDAFRSHILNDYPGEWGVSADPRRSSSVAYPSLVVRPSYRYSEREFHYHTHARFNETSTPVNVADNASRMEAPRAYRNEFAFPNTLEHRAGSRSMLQSPRSEQPTPSRLGEDRPVISYTPSRQHQRANYVPSTGLTRSLTERRPRLARTDKNFRRSFTGRVEDYRAEYARSTRRNFSMETSL
ncbi:hypothetical protein DMN91_011229 [Ooceraea biroi]|uniref:Transmembrane protein 151B n=1 Tax=Ooceraea biroi TaxID=2015173 RepID=A0A3L8D9H2_OOCBI|nr:uncharacterized protein LOC105278645 isoform X1 [Ooceraea biroi]RLU17160.1 hypothetical protein DMN91_011229 [Ooceraea biroi]